MDYHVPEKLNHDLDEPVVIHSASLPWTPSPQQGVERRFLERDGGEVARATSIVRYARGCSFPEHVHQKGEEYLVLSGTFSDQSGDFSEGCYVRNPPGSRHAPFTREGCVIFVKLRQMLESDQAAVVVDTRHAGVIHTDIKGLSRLPLFKGKGGEVVAVDILAPETNWLARHNCGGEEILVLEGRLLYGHFDSRPGTWLRFPAGRELPLTSKTGCRLWTKRGHLSQPVK